MKELTEAGSKVVGLKQTLRAIQSGQAVLVFLAENADEFLKDTVESACQLKNVSIKTVGTMKELGASCGIDREASTAAVLGEKLTIL